MSGARSKDRAREAPERQKTERQDSADSFLIINPPVDVKCKSKKEKLEIINLDSVGYLFNLSNENNKNIDLLLKNRVDKQAARKDIRRVSAGDLEPLSAATAGAAQSRKRGLLSVESKRNDAKLIALADELASLTGGYAEAAKFMLDRASDDPVNAAGTLRNHLASEPSRPQANRAESEGMGPALALPEEAPELYLDRENKLETPIEFLDRVWGKYIESGVVFQEDLRRFDEKIIKNVWSYCQRKRLSPSLYLPLPKGTRNRAMPAQQKLDERRARDRQRKRSASAKPS